LGQIERDEKPVTSRKVLEALALTLRVAPTELTGQPWEQVDPVSRHAHATVRDVETALETFELGHDPGGPVREWPEVAADVAQLVDFMHVYADYAAQGDLAPRLMAELHALYVRDPQHRTDALLGLIHCYSSACWVTKRLGGRGLPMLAARLAQQCADELDAPQWRGYATWLRGDAAGALSRPCQYARAMGMADELSCRLDDPEVIQAYGMLHLSAALAAAAQGDKDTMSIHLTEAAVVADRLDAEVGQFARLWFGRTNVGIWRVALATEFGEGAQVAEIARDVHPDLIPSPSRQAEFWADLGRSLLGESRTRDEGLAAIRRAESLAPQRIRNDLFVREAVASQLRWARQKAGGRELRGLAWRMGIAPKG
ncbi:MAG: helix-turn-helix domain-containing protein, partial [Pseudonocardiaceae bacterium]